MRLQLLFYNCIILSLRSIKQKTPHLVHCPCRDIKAKAPAHATALPPSHQPWRIHAPAPSHRWTWYRLFAHEYASSRWGQITVSTNQSLFILCKQRLCAAPWSQWWLEINATIYLGLGVTLPNCAGHERPRYRNTLYKMLYVFIL